MAAKKKKGLSLDEKRDVMLGLFLESKEVFNAKELEKLGSKAGVVSQTVMEVVKSLVDDRLVETDKIGAGVFFWQFPSKVLVAHQNKLEDAQAAKAADLKTIEDHEKKLAELSKGREDSEKRAADMAEYQALQAQKAELEKSLKAYADSDPETLKLTLEKARKAKEGADRWTDNVWVLKSYLMSKFGKTSAEVDAMMGLPEDFDYA